MKLVMINVKFCFKKLFYPALQLDVRISEHVSSVVSEEYLEKKTFTGGLSFLLYCYFLKMSRILLKMLFLSMDVVKAVLFCHFKDLQKQECTYNSPPPSTKMFKLGSVGKVCN